MLHVRTVNSIHKHIYVILSVTQNGYSTCTYITRSNLPAYSPSELIKNNARKIYISLPDELKSRMSFTNSRKHYKSYFRERFYSVDDYFTEHRVEIIFLLNYESILFFIKMTFFQSESCLNIVTIYLNNVTFRWIF